MHGDLTDDNVVCRRAPDGRLQPYGIIDFGDLMRSWLVGELAITCAATLAHMPRDPLGILPAVQAFDELVPLTDEEIAALWPLIGLRAAALAVSDAQQLAVDPGNVYTAERAHVGWHTLEGVGGLGFAFAEAAFRDALGRPDRPRPLRRLDAARPRPARSRSARRPLGHERRARRGPLPRARLRAPTCSARRRWMALRSPATASTV